MGSKEMTSTREDVFDNETHPLFASPVVIFCENIVEAVASGTVSHSFLRLKVSCLDLFGSGK
jgi:hypothetical protein